MKMDWNNEDYHSFIGIYSLCLFFIGTILNVLSIYICLSKNLRQIPTFLLLSVLLAFDTISLCFWNIDHFLHQFFDYTIEDINVISCRVVTFLQCVSLQVSSWILVSVKLNHHVLIGFKIFLIVFEGCHWVGNLFKCLFEALETIIYNL
jgi:hypothetical protein